MHARAPNDLQKLKRPKGPYNTPEGVRPSGAPRIVPEVGCLPQVHAYLLQWSIVSPRQPAIVKNQV